MTRFINFLIASVCGILCGVAYFYIMDSSIDEQKRKNCSYVSGVVTDILAFVVGAILLWRGVAGNDYIIFTCGMAIIIEHVIQLVAKS